MEDLSYASVEATNGHGGTPRSSVLLAVRGQCVCVCVCVQVKFVKTESVVACHFISF